MGNMIHSASGKNKLTMFPLVIPVSSNKAVYVCSLALCPLFPMCYVTQHHMNEGGGLILFVLPRT